MKVLFLAAESAPYAKSGGLADVAGSLPAALNALGHDVRVIMPRYGSVNPERWGMTPALESLRFPAGFETIEASVMAAGHLGVTTYFVEIPWLFGDRPRMYGDGDDPRRFTLFTAGALAAVERLGWVPDVIHCHDWHTALAPAMLRGGRLGPAFLDTASVLTIHNLAYQGWVERGSLQGAAAFLPHWVGENWINLLGLGLSVCDQITTVSPTYAREILTPEYGERLEGLLGSRQDRLHGVLNGIDQAEFDPSTDPRIPARYSDSDLTGKATCKAELQREAGLPISPEIPVLAMVSRLVDQKGLDLLARCVEPLLASTPYQLIVLGTGDAHHHGMLEHFQYHHPERVRAFLTYDANLAQRLYAGSDALLMPSRFEPCGLSQLIAMRYGTIPIVRGTGGLADTVQEGLPGEPGTGFVFWEYDSGKFLDAMRRALAVFRCPEEWRTLQKRAMKRDSSWDVSARQYAQIYQWARDSRPGR